MDIKQQTAYEQGLNTGANGGTLDDCKYRLSDLKAKWVRGFHVGKGQIQRNNIKPDQQNRNSLGVLSLRAKLNEKEI
jgi:hypothetical protein